MKLPEDRYTIVALGRKQKILYYKEFGSWQGEWLLVSKNKDNYYIYKGWYGSCSGCDEFESYFDDVGWNAEVPQEKIKGFIKKYPPFLVVPQESMQEIVKEEQLEYILPRNIDYEESSAEKEAREIMDILKMEVTR